MPTDIQYRRIVARSSFSPGTPINRATLFAGRSNQIGKGIEIVYQRGWHGIIFGERGVGKTSLANCLADFIPNPRDEVELEVRFLTPRVNCAAGSTFDSIWRDVFARIDISAGDFQEIGFLAEASESFHRLSEILPKRRLTPSDIQHLLDRASIAKPLIVVIDEFDAMRDAESKTLMAHTIKALSDHSVAATLFLVGVADTVDELMAEHQSIERSLIQIPMPRMQKGEVRLLVTKGLERFNQDVDDFKLGATEEALDFICDVSRGMPSYAHLLAQKAAGCAVDRQDQTVNKDHVSEGAYRALDDVQQSVLSAYQRAITSAHKNNLFCEVLTAAAMTNTDPLGFFAPSDVTPFLEKLLHKRVEIATFLKHLKEFCEDRRGQILQRSGEARNYRFRFRDALMPPYIIMRAFADRRLDLTELVGGSN